MLPASVCLYRLSSVHISLSFRLCCPAEAALPRGLRLHFPPFPCLASLSVYPPAFPGNAPLCLPAFARLCLYSPAPYRTASPSAYPPTIPGNFPLCCPVLHLLACASHVLCGPLCPSLLSAAVLSGPAGLSPGFLIMQRWHEPSTGRCCGDRRQQASGGETTGPWGDSRPVVGPLANWRRSDTPLWVLEHRTGSEEG